MLCYLGGFAHSTMPSRLIVLTNAIVGFLGAELFALARILISLAAGEFGPYLERSD